MSNQVCTHNSRHRDSSGTPPASSLSAELVKSPSQLGPLVASVAEELHLHGPAKASFRLCCLGLLNSALSLHGWGWGLGPDTLEGLAMEERGPVGAQIVFCVCIGSWLLAYQHIPLISIIQLRTSAKIAHGQTSWLWAPSFINSNSPSH